jgi:hypothetical protein
MAQTYSSHENKCAIHVKFSRENSLLRVRPQNSLTLSLSHTHTHTRARTHTHYIIKMPSWKTCVEMNGLKRVRWLAFVNPATSRRVPQQDGIISGVGMRRSATVGMPAVRSAFPRSSPRLMQPPTPPHPPAHLSARVRLTMYYPCHWHRPCMFVYCNYTCYPYATVSVAICSTGRRRYDKFMAWEDNKHQNASWIQSLYVRK